MIVAPERVEAYDVSGEKVLRISCRKVEGKIISEKRKNPRFLSKPLGIGVTVARLPLEQLV